MENLELVRNQKLDIFPTSTLKDYSQVGQSSYVQRGEQKGENPPKPKRKLKLHEKIDNQRQTQKHLINLLDEIGEIEQSSKTKMCCQKFVILSCGKHIAQIIPNFRCEFRLCPFCAYRPAERKVKKYLPLFDVYLKTHRATACKLNLTQIQKKGETAEKSLDRLQKSVKKFVDSSFFNKVFDGGSGSYETTVSKLQNPDGNWHFHCHLTVLRKRFLQPDELERLKRLWKRCSPKAENLWLFPVGSLEGDLREQIKYSVKPASIENFDADKLRQFVQLKGRRLFFTFGKFKAFCQKESLDDIPSDATAKEKKKIEKRNSRITLKRELIQSARKRLVPARKEYFEGDCCPTCEEALFAVRLTRNALIAFDHKLQFQKE